MFTKGSQLLWTRHHPARDNKLKLQRARICSVPGTANQETTNWSYKGLGSALYQAPPIKRLQTEAIKDSGLLYTRRRQARENKLKLQRARIRSVPGTAKQETTARTYQWLWSALYQATQSKRQQNGAFSNSDLLCNRHLEAKQHNGASNDSDPLSTRKCKSGNRRSYQWLESAPYHAEQETTNRGY